MDAEPYDYVTDPDSRLGEAVIAALIKEAESYTRPAVARPLLKRLGVVAVKLIESLTINCPGSDEVVYWFSLF
jgi:hypothetical protein